jgi:hypothetical protein
MKLALGSTIVFSVLACSFLFHIGYQFAPLTELAKAQVLAQHDFDAGLTNGDEFKRLSIKLGLRYSLMKVTYFVGIACVLISTISGIVARKRWIQNGATRNV